MKPSEYLQHIPRWNTYDNLSITQYGMWRCARKKYGCLVVYIKDTTTEESTYVVNGYVMNAQQYHNWCRTIKPLYEASKQVGVMLDI